MVFLDLPEFVAMMTALSVAGGLAVAILVKWTALGLFRWVRG